MGLDQYAGLRDSKGEVHEKFYWRKARQTASVYVQAVQ